jgi:hypothetical protein
MRIFLITLAVSTGLSILLWNFGLARNIWPAHPFFTTIAIAAGCGIAVQLLLSRDAATRNSGEQR